jgi:hypothetical protein
VELARHIVRLRRDGTEWRTTNDDVGGAKAKQVRQIRVSAWKLRDLRLARDVESGNAAGRQALAQPADESRPLEPFSLTDGAGILIHQSRLTRQA